MKRSGSCLIALTVFAMFAGCKRNHGIGGDRERAELLHQAEQRLTDIMVYDIFSPPVASRIYAYTSLAAYEALRNEDAHYRSITAQLKGFDAMPKPGNNVDFSIASFHAFCEVEKKLVFSSDLVNDFQQKKEEQLKDALGDDEKYQHSIAYGDQVAKCIQKRAGKDMYKETRGYPRYSVTRKPGYWRPTAPDYMDAVEPYFCKLSPFVLDSARQFAPPGPYAYSLEKNSPYYNDMMEVYNVVNNTDESKKAIASFWDCNPYVGHHNGHLMYATKKITPGGHWMGIARLVCRDQKASAVKTAQVYAWLSVTLFDGFISCWDQKFRTSTIRPETVIQQELDPAWQPLLQCPPFPDYTSGHSVVSAASSLVLGQLLGRQVTYTDSVEQAYGLKPRRYNSFGDAAKEAMISRLYAGIHYRKACEDGFAQGTKVGTLIVEKIAAN